MRENLVGLGPFLPHRSESLHNETRKVGTVRLICALLLALGVTGTVRAAPTFCTDCEDQFQQPKNFPGNLGVPFQGQTKPPSLTAATEIGPEDSLLREFLIALQTEKRITVPLSRRISPQGHPYIEFPTPLTSYQVLRKWRERSRPGNPKYSYDLRIQTQYGPKNYLWYLLRARVQVYPRPLLLKFQAVQEGDRNHLHGAREMPVNTSQFLKETQVAVRDLPTLPMATEVVYELPKIKPRLPDGYRYWPYEKKRIWDNGSHHRP
jgi:hypothetical protein